MNLLENTVAFITGAASGIGRSAALCFAREGAKVAIADLGAQEQAGRAVVAEIEAAGGKAMFVACDVARPTDVEKAIDAAVEAFGRLDVVFANAGINGVWAPIEELEPEEWDRTHDVNLKGTFLTIRYAIPHLRRAGGGSIIITSSVNGTRTFINAGSTAYSASKAGQVALMKTAALELARDNIRVNAICPGATRTNISHSTQSRNTHKIETRMDFPDGPPGLRHGRAEPEDVADVCLFLASPLSRHVSGVELYVDGGRSLAR